MIARSTRILLEVLIGLLAGAIILCGIAVWRLSTGPVELDFLTPHLEAAFNQPDVPVSVEVDSTVLSWGGWPESLDLRARDVKLRDREGFTLASLPNIKVKLSLRALLHGTVAPTLVEIQGADLNLVRGPDGTVQLGDGGTLAQSATSDSASDSRKPEALSAGALESELSAALDQLLAPLGPDHPMGYLSILRVLGAKVSLNDQQLLKVWQIPAADVELRREEDGLSGRLDMEVALQGKSVHFESDISYRPGQRRWLLSARFDEFIPAVLAEVVPDLKPFAGFKLPIAGVVEAEWVGAGLAALSFEIIGGSGELALANVLGSPRAISGAELSGRYDGVARSLVLDRGEVSFGPGGSDDAGPLLELSGRADLREALIAVTLSATLDRVPVDDLGLYWPEQVAANGRAWILENVRGGTARDLQLELALDLPLEDPEAAEVGKVAASFTYEGIAVHFLRPMPPVVGVSGTAAFDGADMTFVPTSGRLDEIQVRSADIKLIGLDGGDHSMAMTLGLEGPLQEALALLDHERLKLIEPLGMDPQDASGETESTVSFQFPLIKDLTFDEMEIEARASLAQVAMRDVLLGQDATEGRLTLDLTKDGMTVSGPLKLAGVPLSMTWREDFTGTLDPRRTLEADVPRLEAEDRATFKFDLRPYLEGPVSTNLVATFRRDDSIVIDAAANLQEATLDLPFLKWRKGPGEPGATRLRLLIVDDQPQSVEVLDLRGGTMEAKGRAALDSSRFGFSQIELDSVSYDRTRLEAVQVVRQGDGFEIAIGGGELDASIYLTSEEAPEARPPPEDQEPVTPLRLRARELAAVYFAEDRYIERVDMTMSRSPVGWELVSVRGLVPQSLRRTSRFGGSSIDTSTLSIDYRPDGAGSYDVNVKTNDMGSVLNALNILETVVGGELEVTGKSAATALDGPIIGRIEAGGYELVNAPALASLLTVASFTGILDLLNGEGIQFQRLTGDFVFDDNVMTTELMRAFGPALGLTAKGMIDLRNDQIDLEGTVVPAYTLNRVLGAIPLLGWILVGGEGEGLLAVTYDMEGDLEQPQVTVNPLAALAPGFLRGLIGFTSADPGEEIDTAPSLYPDDRGR